jgi:hypothetical protein
MNWSRLGSCFISAVIIFSSSTSYSSVARYLYPANDYRNDAIIALWAVVASFGALFFLLVISLPLVDWLGILDFPD